MRLRLARSMAAIAAALIVAAGAAGPAQASGTPGWQVAATIAPGNQEVQLNAVTATAPGDAWAVGDITLDGILVEHWDGTSWQQASVPSAVLSPLLSEYPGLSSVGATSASNVWGFNPVGGWLRFDGSAWTSGRVPAFAGGKHSLIINAALAAGTQEAWAFGYDSTKTTPVVPYAAHFNGTTWQDMAIPGQPGKFGVLDASAVSPGNIWAIVAGGPGTGSANSLVHWNGSHWRVRSLPASLVHAATLASILALPGGQVWVGGDVPVSGGKARGVVALWNGQTWTVHHLPAVADAPTDQIEDLAPDGGGGIWAVGFNPQSCAGPFWHYSAGQWTGPDLVDCTGGAYLHGPQSIANVPGTTSMWGAGGQTDLSVPNNEAGLVLLYGTLPS